MEWINYGQGSRMISDWTLILILDQILILIFNYYTQVEIGYMDLGKECLIKKDYKLDYIV